MRFDQYFLKSALSDLTILYDVFPDDISISVDTRTLVKGDLFIALPGSTHDGHDFVQEALQKGACGFIIAKSRSALLNQIDEKKLKDKLVVLVPDTLKALIAMAAAWRNQFEYPVVGITGSVGKTSTKELLSSILALNGTPYAVSKGNQNTLIGSAINVFNMRENHKVAVFEMGISKRGEMTELARLIRPTTGIITLAGHAHMEGLGSIADIAQEKRRIFEFFSPTNIGIVNGDQPILGNVAYAHPVIRFGYKTINQIQARKIQHTSNGINFVLKIYRKKYPITLSNPHEGAVYNCLAAAAAAHLLGIPEEKIIQGIQKRIVVNGRFEQKALINNKGFIINDAYNANPESMKAALLAFQKMDTSAEKIAVLGDMLELGVNSPFWHRQLGRFLRKVPSLKYVILVGDMVKYTKKTIPVGMSVDLVTTWEEATQKLEGKINDESLILVKGSHGVSLEKLVQKFTQNGKNMPGAAPSA